ncbi:hypothetical protein TKK_0016385 [Trichogramma kaykai]|uniref:Mitochondrial cardiolipin hydrolase n=1 Tax=Trichogramma kaykai TaxID=54128 RepID=A0ABD2W6Q0_9HYME
MSFSFGLGMSSKAVFYTIVSAVASEIVWKIVQKYFYQPSIESEKTMVLFFPDKSLKKRTDLYSKTALGENLELILKYLDEAKKSLDICVFFLSYNPLVNAVIRAKKRRLKIRVITDEDTMKNAYSPIYDLVQNNIEVRSKAMDHYLMHHKFIVIDKKILLNGSANWTPQAFEGNYENIIITEKKNIVKSFIKQFNDHWAKLEVKYDPIPIKI